MNKPAKDLKELSENFIIQGLSVKREEGFYTGREESVWREKTQL